MEFAQVSSLYFVVNRLVLDFFFSFICPVLFMSFPPLPVLGKFARKVPSVFQAIPFFSAL